VACFTVYLNDIKNEGKKEMLVFS